MTDHTPNAAAVCETLTEIQQAMDVFTAERPDWPQYEQVMFQYALKLPGRTRPRDVIRRAALPGPSRRSPRRDRDAGGADGVHRAITTVSLTSV
jgi:hypothetical protein